MGDTEAPIINSGAFRIPKYWEHATGSSKVISPSAILPRFRKMKRYFKVEILFSSRGEEIKNLEGLL